MPPHIYQISDPDQIEALTSAVRQEIVDSLVAMGPSSIAELAWALGHPGDKLYYHIKRLLDVGLIEEVGMRSTARRDEAVYAAAAEGMELRYDLDDAERARLVQRSIASMLRTATRDFTKAFELDEARPEGSRRNLWGARFKAWLSDDELEEINALLQRLYALMRNGQRKEGRTLCSLTWCLAPVDPMPVRRGDDGNGD